MTNRLQRFPPFTWVDLVLAGVILCAAAVLVWPRFTTAAIDPKPRELAATLARIRGLIELYRIEHENRYPTLDRFSEQLLSASKPDGSTTKPCVSGYSSGPYLDAIPVNPFTGTNTVGNGPVGTSAWYYEEQRGEFRANDCAANREL